MKFYNYILILFISLLSSCNGIEKEDIQGYWISFPNGYQESNIWEIEFKGSTANIVDGNSFRLSEEYDIENNKLKIESTYFDLKITDQNSDTIYINETKYVKQKQHLKLDEYKLIGIKFDDKLDENKNQHIPLHCYRNSLGVFKIRAGDKYVDLNDLKFALTSSHSHSYPEIALFIGENITLSELKEVYYEMIMLNIRKAILVVNYRFPNEYDIFEDYIEIWWNDINDYYLGRNSPPLPPIGFEIKSEVLINNYETIVIQDKKDIIKIRSLLANKNYFISINAHLEVSDYIKLKKSISILRSKGISIRTEIIKENET